MAVLVRIKLTNTGPSITGPFSLYCVVGGVPDQSPIVPSITLQQLTSPTGYQVLLPTGCNTIRLLSNGVDCTNYLQWDVQQVSTTSTTTTSSSTTTTTLAPCRCHTVEITGTVTLSYTGCDNVVRNESYTNVIISICARRGTVSKTGTGSINVSVSTTACIEEIDCWEEFIMEANQLPAINGIQIQSTGKYAIEWEPGIYNIYPASNTSRSYTYSTPYTGLVKIKAPSLTFITKIILTTSSVSTTSPTYLHIYGPEIIKLTKLAILDIGYGCNARLYADTNQLSSFLTSLSVFKGTVTGDIDNLANTLTTLRLYGSTTVYGSIQNLPPNLITCAILGSNNINGNLNSLPSSLRTTLKLFQIEGSNDITGDIGYFGTLNPSGSYTALETFRVLGDNTITGNIAAIAGVTTLKSFSLYGKNRLLGNISALAGMSVLNTFIVANDSTVLNPGVVGNELTGDIGVTVLPASLKNFTVFSYNTIGGNISGLPAGITTFDVRQKLGGTGNFTGNLSSIASRPLITFIIQNGSSSFSGAVTSLPSTITSCWLSTSGAITGDIAAVPPNIKSFTIASNNAGSIFTYTPGRTWAAQMTTLDLYTPSAPGIPTLDDLVIDLDGSTWVSITLPSTWGLRLKGTPVSPAAVAAAANIAATPTNVTFY